MPWVKLDYLVLHVLGLFFIFFNPLRYNIHTEKCTKHKRIAPELSQSEYTSVTSTQIKKKKKNQQPPRDPPVLPILMLPSKDNHYATIH